MHKWSSHQVTVTDEKYLKTRDVCKDESKSTLDDTLISKTINFTNYFSKS